MRNYEKTVIHSRWLQFLIISSIFVTTYGGCSFPSDWTGRWFQAELGQVTVNTSYFESKGECVEKDVDKYVVTNERVEKEPCKRCLAVYKRHDNVIQYKESSCLPITYSLDELCHDITGDQPLLSMFRAEDATFIPCPFKSPPYRFQYSRGSTADCVVPHSRIDSCTDDSRLLMKFAACPDIPGTEHGEEELNCLATWKEGSSKYLVAKIKSKSNQGLVTEADSYRCFMYERGPDTIYKMAQSGDATCNGVTSPTEGAKTYILTRLESSHEKCKFPSWVVDHHHWHSLDNSHSYHFSHKNATLRITHEHGPTEMRIVCHHIVANKSMVAVVAHATAGCKNGYICIVFHKRDSGVIQVQKSNEMVQEQSEACVPPFTDPYQMSSPVTLVTVSPSLVRCPQAGRYIAHNQPLWALPSEPDPTCHSNTSLLIGCSTSPEVVTLQACSPESATAYHCQGSWSENQTTYIIASPVSRKSTDAKRYCFILNQSEGSLTLHRLADSCNLSSNQASPPLNLTLQGACLESRASKDSSVMIIPSLVCLKLTFVLLNLLRWWTDSPIPPPVIGQVYLLTFF